MKITILSALSLCLLPASVIATDEDKTATKASDQAAEKKIETTDVQIKDPTLKVPPLTLKVPSTWKQEKNSSSMRLATFSTPTVEGDTERGELTISSFPGGGGGVDQNLVRWVGQFSGEGKTAKITKGKAGDNEYYLADISGTFGKSVGPPILRKTEPAEGYRMLGVILIIEGKGVYFLKLTGPDASVKAQGDLFRQSFGAKKADETEYEI